MASLGYCYTIPSCAGRAVALYCRYARAMTPGEPRGCNDPPHLRITLRSHPRRAGPGLEARVKNPRHIFGYRPTPAGAYQVIRSLGPHSWSVPRGRAFPCRMTYREAERLCWRANRLLARIRGLGGAA